MKEFIKDLIIAIVIVLAITMVIKPTIVKESSMEDTLFENNYLLVNKMAYKFKDHPNHGDIVVFKSEIENTEDGGKKLLIKRVIGVEGDTITISDGEVYRNGELLDEPYVNIPGETYADQGIDVTNLVVPEDEVFCMGDNREVSLDSRSPRVGTIAEKAIVGKAFVRLYPFNEIGSLSTYSEKD
ncbi:MAG: signal peptidase I [Firmicutes bacterium]|nr:signal peptidase I [Bacillota bacterium]